MKKWSKICEYILWEMGEMAQICEKYHSFGKNGLDLGKCLDWGNMAYIFENVQDIWPRFGKIVENGLDLGKMVYILENGLELGKLGKYPRLGGGGGDILDLGNMG